jgi:hypothetical protein
VSLINSEIDDDRDVVRPALRRIRPLIDWDPSRDRSTQPVLVGPIERGGSSIAAVP